MDPITLAVVRGALEQIADEMDLHLIRAAISPIISETNDCAHGIYRADTGETIAQGRFGLPVFLANMQFTVQNLIEHVRGSGGWTRAGVTALVLPLCALCALGVPWRYAAVAAANVVRQSAAHVPVTRSHPRPQVVGRKLQPPRIERLGAVVVPLCKKRVVRFVPGAVAVRGNGRVRVQCRPAPVGHPVLQAGSSTPADMTLVVLLAFIGVAGLYRWAAARAKKVTAGA